MARHIEVVPVGYDPKTGGLDLRDLAGEALGEDGRGLFRESRAISAASRRDGRGDRARSRARHGAETIVGVDPDLARRARAAGRLRRRHRRRPDPAARRAHELRRRRRRLHRHARRGALRRASTRRFLVSITETARPGEHGFGARPVRTRPPTACARRASDWTGNSVYLWAIANAVYMSLLGPAGLPRGRRADPRTQPTTPRTRLAEIKGVRDRASQSGFFKEFVVNFDGTGKTVARDQQGAAASAASSAARTSRRTSRSSARARSTA